MSSWITREDCVDTLKYYKEVCESEDEAYCRAADSLDISEDKLIEMVNEAEE